MHNALHPRDDVDRLYVSKKKGGREIASIQDSVDTSIQRLKDYFKKRVGSDYSDQKQYRQHKHQ